MCRFKIGTVFDNKWWHWSEILTETHNLWQPKHNYIVLNTSRISLWIQQTWSSVQKLTLQLQRAQWKLHLIIHNKLTFCMCDEACDIYNKERMRNCHCKKQFANLMITLSIWDGWWDETYLCWEGCALNFLHGIIFEAPLLLLLSFGLF